MEVMKSSYLLLDGAGDNSVLFFYLIDWNRLLGTGWNRSSKREGIAHRNEMESLVGTR